MSPDGSMLDGWAGTNSTSFRYLLFYFFRINHIINTFYTFCISIHHFDQSAKTGVVGHVAIQCFWSPILQTY